MLRPCEQSSKLNLVNRFHINHLISYNSLLKSLRRKHSISDPMAACCSALVLRSITCLVTLLSLSSNTASLPATLSLMHITPPSLSPHLNRCKHDIKSSTNKRIQILTITRAFLLYSNYKYSLQYEVNLAKRLPAFCWVTYVYRSSHPIFWSTHFHYLLFGTDWV